MSSYRPDYIRTHHFHLILTRYLQASPCPEINRRQPLDLLPSTTFNHLFISRHILRRSRSSIHSTTIPTHVLLVNHRPERRICLYRIYRVLSHKLDLRPFVILVPVDEPLDCTYDEPDREGYDAVIYYSTHQPTTLTTKYSRRRSAYSYCSH